MALRLLGADPAGLGGLWLRARAGPVRERLLAQLATLPLPVIRLHPATEREALDGGLDLTATLAGVGWCCARGCWRGLRCWC